MMMKSAPLILLSDDDQSIRLVASKALNHAGFQVKTAESLGGLMALIEHHDAAVLVSDVVYPDGDALEMLRQIKSTRPDLSIIMMSARSTLLTALKAREGEVFAYLPKPFALEVLVDTVKSALIAASKSAAADAPVSDSDHGHIIGHNDIIGTSPAMQDIFRSMARLVPTDLSVMITGESGTGKEVVARALHDLGGRQDRAFIALNMAAIPRDLIESELFGHEKGAFTGADRRQDGRFAQAQGGTLFLDEIGDMPADAQTRLLRVLQDGNYTRVGGRELIKSDARIIAATHQSLPRLIDQGQFREDLYYRLNVVPLNLPPLRERREDIPDLVRHFMARATKDGLKAKRITPEAMDIMMDHLWPGNVRELENLILRLLVLVDDDTVTPKDLPAAITPEADLAPSTETLSAAVALHIDRFFTAHADDLPAPGLYVRVLEEVERPLILATLQATGGNQMRTAEILGLNRNTLRKKIQTLGIAPAGTASASPRVKRRLKP
jgi:two-component system nitrogen regulation response regulator GlnG